jgi:predicted nucleotidyltransferase/DNA-binding MarR family transcriptional regulator
MRLIRSPLALKVVTALAATEQAGLSELARAVRATTSAVQRALELLVDDGIAQRASGGRPAYRLRTTERATNVATLALSEAPFVAAVVAGARANASVEFVGRERDGLLVVFAAGSTARSQARAARYFERLAAREGLRVTYMDHDDVRRELLTGPALRRRMSRTEIVHGDLERTFPDRSRHATRHGRPLHRPHPSLPRPSRSFAARLVRAHGLAALRLFGSAVRSDFRPDSDVDVLIRHQPDVRPSLRSLMALERELESAFGRDVEVVREETMRPEVRERVAREAVSLV